jgi:hypothetical protein
LRQLSLAAFFNLVGALPAAVQASRLPPPPAGTPPWKVYGSRQSQKPGVACCLWATQHYVKTMVADFRDVRSSLTANGGSTLEDSSHMVRQLVTQYLRPRCWCMPVKTRPQEGRTGRLPRSMKRLVQGARASCLAHTSRVISIKPSRAEFVTGDEGQQFTDCRVLDDPAQRQVSTSTRPC